jgi:hypothetical protein
MEEINMARGNGNSFKNLTAEQKDFIKARVIELGTLEKIEEFYFAKCLISRYATKMAREAGIC